MAELSYSMLDPHLVVWGVVTRHGAVRAFRSEADAQAHGSCVVYYHPEAGWVVAATGRPYVDQQPRNI